MSPLFDSYVMVDWSAESRPKQGEDSIWIAYRRRLPGGAGDCAGAENPATRAAAMAAIEAMLQAELAAGRRVLLGFDFPLGYPRGLAARLGLEGPPWRAIWQDYARRLVDDENNRNDRFVLADGLNRRVSGTAAFPFWGRPAKSDLAALRPNHHRLHATGGLAERRLVEERTPTAQTVWKLLGVGAAGSQALTGIPRCERLKQRFGPALQVWPFETALAAPVRPGPAITLVEIYPSLFPVDPEPGEVKDAAQTRTTARHFAELDSSGNLAALFAGDPALSEIQKADVIAEEGWVLGVTASKLPPPGPQEKGNYEYLTDPAAIYAKSFAIARAETDLSSLPPELHGLALRIVHAAADPGLVRDLAWSPGAAAAGRQALASGAPVLVDVEMVAHGITRVRLPCGNEVVCTLRDPRGPILAAKLATTRSAAALELWRDRLADAVVAIGNAPTALFHLLEMIAAGAPRPALVLGFPVGFVGAAEAKAALVANRLGLAYVALAGRRGGSALAAAAVNALAAPEEAGT